MVTQEQETAESLIRSVYPELRCMAARLLSSEREGHTLQPTALTHEALIRLFGRVPEGNPSAQELLFRAALQMRQILVDSARKHRAAKRGGKLVRVPLFEGDHIAVRDDDSILALNEALDQLGKIDARALSIVELKFFCGLTNAEAANVLAVSEATIETGWQFARIWLFGALAASG